MIYTAAGGAFSAAEAEGKNTGERGMEGRMDVLAVKGRRGDKKGKGGGVGGLPKESEASFKTKSNTPKREKKKR